MSWIHGLSQRLKALVRRGQLERQLEKDIRFHIEMETEKNVRAGMTEEEARRAARSAFGRVEDTKESVRDERGVGLIENLMRETRFALRRLRRRPTFTAVVVIYPRPGDRRDHVDLQRGEVRAARPASLPGRGAPGAAWPRVQPRGDAKTAGPHDRIVFRLPRPIAERGGS